MDMLNEFQCGQAGDCVIMRDEPPDPQWYRDRMRPARWRAASDVLPLFNGDTLILNFLSINPRGPKGLPSFLRRIR